MKDWKLAKNLLLREKHVEFYHDGKEIYYTIDGKKEGECKRQYSNGQLKIHYFYKNDKLDGEYKQWWKTGKLAVHCFYKDGELDGEYKEWHRNGQLTEHRFYKNDKVIKCWHKEKALVFALKVTNLKF